MSSFFDNVSLAPPNSILGVALECKNDSYSKKIDLTIGAYRDENGKPSVLKSVRDAEIALIEQNLDHEYLSQDGHAEFNRLSQILMFGEESPVIAEGRVFSIQGISGTGSLRLAADFIAQFMPGKKVFIPDTTWGNHPAILEASRIPQGEYRYLDGSGCRLDFKGLMEDFRSFPDGSCVILHACAHNPSGVDPTTDQWREILTVFQEKGLLPWFDNAYQGFVSGDPTEDAFAVRLFVESGLETIVACSFAKNFGLYGERCGSLHFVARSASALPPIASQLRVISRVLYSTCPAQGARIVALILGDPTRRAQWLTDCRAMAERLNGVRKLLFDTLVRLNVKGEWRHVIEQRGMFSYTGISAPTVARLKQDYHIYMLGNGRISLAGLNAGNCDQFVSALADILGHN